MQKQSKILIVRTDRLGDLVLSTPVINNLRLFYPKAHIAFMCRPYTRGALEGNPKLDEVIVYDKYGKQKSFWASIKFSFYLRKKKFDLVFILHPTNRVHWITFLAGIPKRIGWDKKLSVLLTKRVKHRKQEGKKHELEYTLDILRAVDIPIKSKDTYFPITPEVEARIEQLLKNKGIEEGDKFIVIHPSSSCISKRWPEENFLKLIGLLRNRLSFKIIVITSQEERKFGEKLVSETGVIDLRGSLSISEVGALLKQAALFISNDSGPVHIADSFNIPVISIFGRGDSGLSPLRWGPRGKMSFCFHKDPGCIKCLAHDCIKDFRCLREITPSEVVEKSVSFFKI
ncbi:MAG: glycosyltransferase family 9 protein [Candidatus Omnitrophica bacterium]|nr:glycosyltransferase family 9 protein [Candidatus Omnitrophota bacterium]